MTSFWAKLSAREQLLAVASACLVFLFVAVLITMRAVGHLAALDTTIERLEHDLITYHHQEMRSQSVEAAFADVAAEHSSAWTQEEIHDRLRREIYRLALYHPYPTGSRGVSSGSNPADYMVQIPRLNTGTLRPGGEGYREYQIAFDTPPTTIDNLVAFLERLQQSPQSLRIDAIEIRRPAEATSVNATIEVTRTVVAGAGDDETLLVAAGLLAGQASPDNLARNPSFEEWQQEAGRFPDWEAVACSLDASKDHVTAGSSGLSAKTLEPNARIYQTQSLESGGSYELSLDVVSSQPGYIRVAGAEGEEVLPGGQELLKDNGFVQYQFRFSAPERQREFRVPEIVVAEAGTEIHVDNVILKRIAE